MKYAYDRPKFCPKCNKEVDWKNIPWNISISKGYKVKEYNCECGNPMTKYVPTSDEKKEIWSDLERMISKAKDIVKW